MSQVRIEEAYRDYTPPIEMTVIIRKLLGTVPDKYLQDLDCVVLTNEASLSRNDRVGKVWTRKRKFKKSRILSRYRGGSRDSRPCIELRVDRIIEGLQGTPLRIPFLREIGFGHVLFHEIGHHIHRTVRPEHKEKEDVADSWSRKLNANYVRKKYWYARAILGPAFKIYKLLRRKEWI